MADIILKLKLDGKEYDAVIQNADKQLSDLRKKTESFPDAASKWGQIVTGFNQGLELANKLFDQFKESVMKGAELQVLRDNFKGAASDIELFRQATGRTVREADLIKLSNQATDLGISLKQQAILFSLAEDAGDKYGGSTESNFQKIVNASEGAGKGLKSLGIQQEVFNSIVERSVKATGKKLEQLDAETIKQIKLNAIIEASGVTLEDVTNKTQDNADKLAALGVRVDEAKDKMGLWISEQLVPLVDILGTSKDGTADLSDAVITLTASLPNVLISLMALKSLTGGATLAALGKYIALPVGLGVAGGMAWDEWGRETFGVNDLSNTDYSGVTGPKDNKDYSFLSGNKRFVPGTGTVTIIDEPKKVKENVTTNTAEIKKAQEELARHKKELERQFIEDYYNGLKQRGDRHEADRNKAGEFSPSRRSPKPIDASGTVTRQKSDKELYDDMTVEGRVFFDGMMGMTDTFWSNFIMSGRQAKDPWDALWLSFYNSAMRSIGDLVTNGIMDLLLNSLGGAKGAKGGGGGFMDIIGTLFSFLPFFGTGGIVTSPTAAVVGDVPEAIIPLHQLNNFSFGSGNIEKKLDQVIKAFQDKQFEIDLFKLRTANQSLNEVVKALAVTV